MHSACAFLNTEGGWLILGIAPKSLKIIGQEVADKTQQEIASPGTFPPQITPENIKEPYKSYPHNLKVAEALYRMTYLENWDSGARRIMDACEAQGVEVPTWCSDGGFVTITFKRPYKAESDTRQREVPFNHRSTTDQVPLKFKK